MGLELNCRLETQAPVNRMRSCGLLLLAATFLPAESTQSWKAKPVEQWDNEDAKQILADSPWVGHATLQNIPDRSPGERRDSVNAACQSTTAADRGATAACAGTGRDRL